MNKHSFTAFISKNKLFAATIFGVIFTILISLVFAFTNTFITFFDECDEIRHDVLRLHILANSNTQLDQQLKLKVRDRILQLDNQLFEQADNLDEAKTIASDKLELIKNEALDEISRQGYQYDVKIELKKMYFQTREYDTFTLPAGNYDALRLTIGSGNGKNWWCVLYPPLCLPAATQSTELEDVLSPKQIDIVKNKSKYKFKFAAVEFYEKIKEFFS